jgi:hypothetical protein
MRWRYALGLGLGMLSACSRDSTAPHTVNQESGGTGGDATLSGVVYGITNAPDSTVYVLPGVRVVLVRIGDLAGGGGGGVDTILPPPGTDDTLLMARGALLTHVLTPADTVVPPDTSSTPPPQPACPREPVAAAATTTAEGVFSVTGLVEGNYAVRVEPGDGSTWSGTEYCGLPVLSDGENTISFYLSARPGPGPEPGSR